MFLVAKLTRLAGRIAAVALALMWLHNAVSAEPALLITNSPEANAAVGVQFVTPLTMLLLGTTAFCASVFWWRRDQKIKDSTMQRTVGDGSQDQRDLRARFDSAAAVKTNPNDLPQLESNIDVNKWIQENMRRKSNAARQQSAPNGASAQHNQIPLELTGDSETVPTFEMPPPVSQLIPLIDSDDPILLEAIDKVFDFNQPDEERELAVVTMSEFLNLNSVETLSEVALFDTSSRLRVNAINALGAFNHESVFEVILIACADPAREARAAAARILSRLDANRADAFARIVESNDHERIRLAAMACAETGMAARALARLLHTDAKQAAEAFAILRLLVAAHETNLIINALNQNATPQMQLTLLGALRLLRPSYLLSPLCALSTDKHLSDKVRPAVCDLISELNQV